MFGVIRMVTGHGNKLLLGVRFFFQPRYHTTPGRIFQPLLQFFYRIIAILHKEELTSYTFHTTATDSLQDKCIQHQHRCQQHRAMAMAAPGSGTASIRTIAAAQGSAHSGKHQHVEHPRLFCAKTVVQRQHDPVYQQDGSCARPPAKGRSASQERGCSHAQNRIAVMNNPPITAAAETAVQSRPTRYFSAT